MIATLAIKFNLEAWTLDKHFTKMSQVLQDLIIFKNTKHKNLSRLIRMARTVYRYQYGPYGKPMH